MCNPLAKTALAACLFLAASAVRAGSPGASSYAQGGLVGHYDGIDNAGTGTHDPGAAAWKDLAGALGDGVLGAGAAWRDGNCWTNAVDGRPVTLGAVFSTNVAAKTFTVELVLKPDAVNVSRTLLGNYSSVQNFNIECAADARIRCYYAGNPDWYPGAKLAAGQTSVLTLVTTPWAQMLYTNGVFAATRTGTIGAALTAGANTIVGGELNRATMGFRGAYYALRVYNRALTAGETAVNANLDRIRFEGADPEALSWPDGYRLMNDAIEVRHTVSTPVSGATVSVNGAAEAWCTNGAPVTVAATAPDGYSFVSWSGDVAGLTNDLKASTMTFPATITRALVAIIRAAGEERIGCVATTGSDETGDGSADAPWRTIGHAIDDPSTTPGTVIRVQGGLYRESITNGVTSAAKSGMTISGGWGTDWTRNPAANPTILMPPEGFVKKVPCLYFRQSTTNTFSGLVLTGGSHGFYAPYATPDIGDNNVDWNHHTFSQMVVTNNVTGFEVRCKPGAAVLSSLVADNEQWGFYRSWDNGGRSFLNNCTFAGNRIGVESAHSYQAYGWFRNCVFADNVIHYKTNSGAKSQSFWNCCFGSGSLFNTAVGVDGWRYFDFYSSTFFADPLLDADRRPTAASPLLKAGQDLSAFAPAPVFEDLEGTPWNGEWDIGCYKSAYPAVPVAKYAEQHVAPPPAGSDANDGASAAAPRATLQSALDHVADGGTVHAAAGVYEGPVFVRAPRVTLAGAGRDATIIRVPGGEANAFCTNGFAAVEVYATNVVLHGFAAQGGLAGVYVRPPAEAKFCVVSNCAFTANGYGVYTSDSVNDGTSAGHWVTLSHCPVTNNLFSGVKANETVYMDNLLIARNGYDGVRNISGDRHSASIAVNCTIADNAGNGVYNPASWASFQDYYNCVIAGHKIGAYRKDDLHSGGIRLYNCVLANATNCWTYRITTNDCVEVADARLQTNRIAKLFWPLQGSPVAGVASNRNATLAVKVYDDLAGHAIRFDRPYDVGCFQLLPPGGFLFCIR